LLEYESPRAGDFAPLRFIPAGKMAVLGLMSTKQRALESVDDLKRRVEDAARFIDIDQLGLCPQCGFASSFDTDRLTIDDEEKKLARLVEAAAAIWG
jgi:5-methyltetrahydropteroyltriglutamate--homocysteine methyltransferase